MAGTPVLVVVDVQNDFCHPDGAVAKRGDDLAPVQAAVKRIKDAIAWMREQQQPVIFVRVLHNDWYDTPEWVARHAQRDYARKVPVVVEGTWGAEFYEVDPQPGDLVLTKIRYSAFQYTPLEVALRRMGSRFLLAGTQTDVCVEATAMDGLQRGFSPVVLTDCVVTPQPAVQQQVLERLRYRGIATMSLDEARHLHADSGAGMARVLESEVEI